MPGTFMPKHGQRYVANFRADADRCYGGMQVVTAAGPVKEPSDRLRKWTTTMWGDGAFCE